MAAHRWLGGDGPSSTPDQLAQDNSAAELGLTLNAVLLAKSRVLKRLREELRGVSE